MIYAGLIVHFAETLKRIPLHYRVGERLLLENFNEIDCSNSNYMETDKNY